MIRNNSELLTRRGLTVRRDVLVSEILRDPSGKLKSVNPPQWYFSQNFFLLNSSLATVQKNPNRLCLILEN